MKKNIVLQKNKKYLINNKVSYFQCVVLRSTKTQKADKERKNDVLSRSIVIRTKENQLFITALTKRVR